MNEAQRPVVFLAKEELIKRYHQAVEDTRRLYPNENRASENVKATFYQSMKELIEQLSVRLP